MWFKLRLKEEKASAMWKTGERVGGRGASMCRGGKDCGGPALKGGQRDWPVSNTWRSGQLGTKRRKLLLGPFVSQAAPATADMRERCALRSAQATGPPFMGCHWLLLRALGLHENLLQIGVW